MGGRSGRLSRVGGQAVFCMALAWASASMASEQCKGDGPHLRVVVDGLRSNQGYVSVELYPDDSKLFLAHNQQLAVAHDRLERASAVVCLTAPKPGMYALSVYHDENGDDQFNRNKLGIPLEGVGLSNNPKILFGLPPFERVRFRIADGETTIHVGLRYFLGRHAPPESTALADSLEPKRLAALP